MEGKLEASAAAALSKISPEKLLLLGLQLLSKNNVPGVPRAVVRPRPQAKSESNPLPSPPHLSRPLVMESKLSPPSSPEEHQQVPQSATQCINRRKRKRGESEELSLDKKREKRKLMNRIAAQNARDRKKSYVTDLERRVAELEAKNEKLERENRSLQAKTDGLFAEKRQLETQLLSHEPYTPSPTEPSVGSLTLVGNNEKLLESGSAAEADSESSLCSSDGDSEFDSLVHLLQDYWPDCGITCGGSHDPLDNIMCQSHDIYQPQGFPQEASVVGGQAIYMESPIKLNSDPLLGPTDPLATAAAMSLPLSDSAPADYKHCTLSDFSDIPDTELEKLLSPFTTNSGTNFDPDSFDIESFVAA